MTTNKTIKVFALGGLGEVGKNMYCVEQNDELIIIDSGILFPDFDYGVNYIIPDFTYLKQNEKKIVGLFITHGHEDHIGAIPYLLKEVKIKNVYASGLAIGLIKNKLNEFKNVSINLVPYDDNTLIKLKNFEITFFRTNHSIPDSFGIAIKTYLGYILHTGDFKFDFTPIGKITDYHKLTTYGEEGTLLLLSDSTNANTNNFSLSERKISDNLLGLFENIKGRIIISTFASNVYRIEQIIDASIKCNRKVIVFGKSMEKTINVAQQLSYIKAPKSTFISPDELNTLKPNQITILSTGSQGEPLAALSRIAEGTHKLLKLSEGDTIVFSSSAIPGNQEHINRTINKLYKAGANVIINNPLTDTHTSGHASPSELQLMINLCKPKYFMPIHGELAMQKRHEMLAIECGIKPRNCFILKNGEVLSINDNKIDKRSKVKSGYTAIDDDNNIISDSIIKERKALADNGIVTITYIIHKNQVVQKPALQSRGFIYMKSSNELISLIQTKAYKLANTYLFQTKNNHFYENKFKKDMSEIMFNFINEQTNLKPIVETIVISI